MISTDLSDHPADGEVASWDSTHAVADAWRHSSGRTGDVTALLLRLKRWMPTLGITRVADATGLDRIGIPVAMASRPNSKSLSVSMGKGLTIEDAKLSAIMESVESWHAENILLPLRLATPSQMVSVGKLVDLSSLPLATSAILTDWTRLLWVEGEDLKNQRRSWLPFAFANLDLTIPLPEGSALFPPSSTGLGAGFTRGQAIAHGLAEVIEADALSFWGFRTPSEQDARRIDPDQVADPVCRHLLHRIHEAGLLVGLWDIADKILIPTFLCRIMDAEVWGTSPFSWVDGSASHVNPAVALAGAILEAAQGRVTQIAGARDDNYRSYYGTFPEDILEAQRQRLRTRPGTALRSLAERLGDASPRCLPVDRAQAVAMMVDRLDQAGLSQVLAVDLTQQLIGIPVVKIVVPGAEDGYEAAHYQAGPRLSAAMA
ncbi:YcaO-like family protein (plasmid) [Skermanella sp. TT6]|uniref:YcaO-like family protein n=1 Tax=Skermanella cutis TaxID=2775420 RepID=A0ABX7BFM6_9PROT|nr:YcaO-like family protein [Skermanella sp. TT6]QQP93206.1 YcaO-like family protein [Skermanella sp. TT6]